MVQSIDDRVPEALDSSSRSSSKAPSRNPSNLSKSLTRQSSSVGSLCADLPNFVTAPPIEAVVFGWGVAEDGQLVSSLIKLACPFPSSCSKACWTCRA